MVAGRRSLRGAKRLRSSSSKRSPSPRRLKKLPHATPASALSSFIRRQKNTSVASPSSAGASDAANFEELDSPAEDLSCPVAGCSSADHLNGKNNRHNFKEACPSFHNLTSEECKSIYQLRRNLALNEKQKDSRVQALSGKEQRKLLANICAKRENFEDIFQKKLARGGFLELLSSLTPESAHHFREPVLTDVAFSHDYDLFRMAQASLADELEHKPNLRNRESCRINYVRIGEYEIEAVNVSCYPQDFSNLERIFVCELCLKYFKSLKELTSHSSKCTLSGPPGVLIYKKQALRVWKVDGSKNKIYCQNLCLLAKLFLDHKTLYYDVEPFYFYILTEYVDGKHHLAGYFSKEKQSMMNCVLSCLLTLPPYQCRGYGKMLIELSYILSKMEDKIGSPEHPLSDLGLIAYRSYWKEKILEYLLEQNDKTFSVKDLSQKTGIHANDLVSTLQYYNIVKYWRGAYWICSTQDFLAEHGKKFIQAKKYISKRIDTSCLTVTHNKNGKMAAFEAET